MVVQMVKVLTITVITVLLLLKVVLLLSLLLYQDHYLEATVESCQKKKELFEFEQNTSQNRPMTTCIIIIVIIFINGFLIIFILSIYLSFKRRFTPLKYC